MLRPSASTCETHDGPWPALSHSDPRAMDDSPSDTRLESWKAIARHLGCSVRSARRWEADEGLPVHRHMHRAAGRVFAWPQELDAWRATRTAAPATQRDAQGPAMLEALPREREAVVVLPFTGGRSEREADLADGLAEELIEALSRLPGLRVISRTSALALEGRELATPEIAALLRVHFLIEGAVRRRGETLRVSIRLVDAEADELLWSERYEDRIDEASPSALFEVPLRIARDVAAALRFELDGRSAARSGVPAFSTFLAWQARVRARREALRWRRDAIEHALELLDEALAAEGEHVELLTLKARTLLHLREAGIDGSEGPLRSAEALAARARALDPGAPSLGVLEGWLCYQRGELPDAVRALRKALAPGWHDVDGLGLLANCLLLAGRPAAAAPVIRRVLDLDPLTPLHRCMPGWLAACEGRSEDSIGPYRAMYEADPTNPVAAMFLANVLVLAGRDEEVAALVGALPGALAATPPGRVARAFAGAASGEGIPLDPERDGAVAASAGDMFPRMLGEACARAGDADGTARWLGLAVDRGYANHPYLSEHQPWVRALGNDARVAEVLERARVAWVRFEEVLD